MVNNTITANIEKLYNQEKELEDGIFKHPTNITSNNINHNIYDYTVQCFNSRPNDIAYALHQNNMITNIRNEPGIESFGHNHNIGKNDNESYHGIYIIENYVIHRRSANNAINIINYIKNTTNIDISDNEKENLIKHVNRSNGTAEHIKIRIVSVLPENILNKYLSTYIKRHNLVITKHNPINTNSDMLIHPLSILAEKMNIEDAAISYIEDNIVSISIVNNDNHNKPYFIKIGDNVVRIMSKKDNTNPSGYKFTWGGNT